MTTRTRRAGPRWRVPAALLALSFVPVLAGAFRLTQLVGGARTTEENARYFASPAPIVAHIVGVTVFCVLGAFQFVPRRRSWHRVSGRLVLPCGLVGALSGLWMTLSYPPLPGDGTLLVAFRLVFGSLMAVALVLAFAAIRRRDVAAHRAWMTRAYAIGLGAGTQAVVTGLWVAFAGAAVGTTRALLLGAGWVLNLVVAETIVARKEIR